MISQNEMIENIRAAWNAASDDQINRGRAWYPVAHDLAEMIGHGNVRKGAGILSALSPRCTWDLNITRAIDAGNGKTVRAMGDQVRKVAAIMNGAAPEDVLPMSAKTGNFFLNIVDPTDATAVTVDCWAYRIATHDWKSDGRMTAKQYRTIADAYRIVASELGEVANVVQAGTWNWARETNH